MDIILLAYLTNASCPLSSGSTFYRVCACRLRESGSALHQQPAPCVAAARTTSPHNRPSRSCLVHSGIWPDTLIPPHHLFGQDSTRWRPALGNRLGWVLTPWLSVSLIMSVVCRCVLSWTVVLVWFALLFLVPFWCGLSVWVWACAPGLVWSTLVSHMP